MEQDPTSPSQEVDSQRNLITNLINHYEPEVDVTDDYYQSISEKYPNTDSLVTKLINHYDPESEVTTGYLEGLYDKYNVKKKRRDRTTDGRSGASRSSSGRNYGCRIPFTRWCFGFYRA